MPAKPSDLGGDPSLSTLHPSSISDGVFCATDIHIYFALTSPSAPQALGLCEWIMESMMMEWAHFLDRCLESRVQPDLFAAAVTQLHAKSPLPGRKLATLLLKPRAAATTSIDPRVIVYLERLLALKKVNASDVLAATFEFSKDRLPKTGEDESAKDPQWNNPPELEEIVFHRLHRAFVTEERPMNIGEGIRTLLVVTRWMQAMVTSHTSDTMIQAMAGIQQGPQQQSINVREGLGMLVVGIIENSKMLDILSNPKGKGVHAFCPLPRQLRDRNALEEQRILSQFANTRLDIRKAFAQSLSSFIPFLSHNSVGSQTSLQLANRLEISQKQHDFYNKLPTVNGETNGNPGLEVAVLQLEAVMDLPLLNTRAGLYVWLNSLVRFKPCDINPR